MIFLTFEFSLYDDSIGQLETLGVNDPTEALSKIVLYKCLIKPPSVMLQHLSVVQMVHFSFKI